MCGPTLGANQRRACKIASTSTVKLEVETVWREVFVVMMGSHLPVQVIVTLR